MYKECSQNNFVIWYYNWECNLDNKFKFEYETQSSIKYYVINKYYYKLLYYVLRVGPNNNNII